MLQGSKSPQQQKELFDTVRVTCFQVDGVLTTAEAARFVETAERNGFEHQGSRGAAFGEVSVTDVGAMLLSDKRCFNLKRLSGLLQQVCPLLGVMLAVQGQDLL